MPDTTVRPDNYRIRFVIDPDGSFTECNGEPRPLTEEEYAGVQYMRDGKPVSYADYLAYYGNPDRHVYIGAMLERRCTCCGSWSDVDSLWNIDCMDDNEEVRILTHSDRTYGAVSQYYMLPTELNVIPGYLRDVTRELLPDDADRVARTDADLITAICEVIDWYSTGIYPDDRADLIKRYGTDTAAFATIREIMLKRCEPVTGPDPRD
jgi:hypothetical protein